MSDRQPWLSVPCRKTRATHGITTHRRQPGERYTNTGQWVMSCVSLHGAAGVAALLAYHTLLRQHPAHTDTSVPIRTFLTTCSQKKVEQNAHHGWDSWMSQDVCFRFPLRRTACLGTGPAGMRAKFGACAVSLSSCEPPALGKSSPTFPPCSRRAICGLKGTFRDPAMIPLKGTCGPSGVVAATSSSSTTSTLMELLLLGLFYSFLANPTWVLLFVRPPCGGSSQPVLVAIQGVSH